MTDASDTEVTPEEQFDEPSARADAIISIVVGVAAVAFLLGSRQYVGVRTGSSDPGAAFWPRIVLVVILLATAVNLAKTYRRSDAALGASLLAFDGGLKRALPPYDSAETRKYLLSTVLIVGYLLVLTDLGFIVSSILFSALFVWLLGYRSVWRVGLFSVVTTVLIFVVFRNFMNIALPYGTGVFRSIGIFVEGLL
ncbi:tripartite tricarboxylate transporter TctB family protein [Halorarum salinum]|uniref:Tripartite tricarboxylate transporter TctB family protein n=1 Tax=Halorarum salinum TaxID=2743089 RepID=A0A7D5Q8S1_9EURY|nr:tripartite tricarboxylate transporter TctB family protein [Halobaculum salinum]QLG61157.1 tripartite tricarboxylate transporter TctB family protein [Halobaculum salinum]